MGVGNNDEGVIKAELEASPGTAVIGAAGIAYQKPELGSGNTPAITVHELADSGRPAEIEGGISKSVPGYAHVLGHGG